MKKYLVSLSILIVSYAAKSQTDLTNAGVLYVSTNSDVLFINGSFNNQSGANFVNNGNLYVTQNISNNQAGMNSGSGKLFLNGATLQAISGAATFKTYDLETNNAEGFVLNNNLSVSGAHVYTAGMITTSATPNYMTYESGSSYSGSNDAKHVNGWVKKFGMTNFTFPVGTNTMERTVSISNLTALSEFNVRYTSPTPNSIAVQPPLILVNSNEYWVINKISGGSANVTLNWDNSKINFPAFILTDIRATNYNGLLWTSIGGSAVGNPATSGAITSNAVNTFGSFALGSMGFLLSGNDLKISAYTTNEASIVEWTCNQQGVDKFIIEKKNGDGTFSPIGSVAHELSNRQGYAFKDFSVSQGTSYYRVRAVTNEGNSYISSTASVTHFTVLSGEPFSFASSSRAIVTVKANGNINGRWGYEVLSANGQSLQQGTLQFQNGGRANIVLPVVAAKGIYVVRMRNGAGVFTQKIWVE